MEKHLRAAEQAARDRIAEQNRRRSEARGSGERGRGQSADRRIGSFEQPSMLFRGRMGSRGSSASMMSGSQSGGLPPPIREGAAPGLGPRENTASAPGELSRELSFAPTSTGSAEAQDARAEGAPPGDPRRMVKEAARSMRKTSPGLPEMAQMDRAALRGARELPGAPERRPPVVKGPPRVLQLGTRPKAGNVQAQLVQLGSENDILRGTIDKMRSRLDRLQFDLERAMSSDETLPGLKRQLAIYDQVVASMGERADVNALTAGFMQLSSLRRVALTRLSRRGNGNDIMKTWPNLQRSAFDAPAQDASQGFDRPQANGPAKPPRPTKSASRR